MTEDGRQLPGVLDDSAVFETYHHADDVLYIGSDDEHYESPSHRLQRCREQYNAFNQTGWRVPPVLLTAGLKGPFSSDVWDNPWRSRSAVPVKMSRKGKNALTGRVTKPFQDAAPPTTKPRPIPVADSMLGHARETTTNILKPKAAIKSNSRRPAVSAQRDTSEPRFAHSRRNPKKRSGSSTDWLRRVNSPKRQKPDPSEEPFASSPTDKLGHQRSRIYVSTDPSTAGSSLNHNPQHETHLQPHYASGSSLFPDEDTHIEDSFVVDEHSLMHTPTHPSRVRAGNLDPLRCIGTPRTDDSSLAIARARFLIEMGKSPHAAAARTSNVAGDTPVNTKQGTARICVGEVSSTHIPSAYVEFTTQQDDSFCYRARAMRDTHSTSGTLRNRIETRAEGSPMEGACPATNSASRLVAPLENRQDMAGRSNAGHQAQGTNMDGFSRASRQSDPDHSDDMNAATNVVEEMNVTAAADATEEDTIPAAFSVVKAEFYAPNAATSLVARHARKQHASTADETLVPENGCTTMFDSEETTLLAEPSTNPTPSLLAELKDSGVDVRSKSVASAERDSLPASSHAISTPRPPQATEISGCLLQLNLGFQHQTPTDNVRILSQSSVPASTQVNPEGLPLPHSEAPIDPAVGHENPTLLISPQSHSSTASALIEDDVWDCKVEYNDSHRATFQSGMEERLVNRVDLEDARLATQDQSPWAASYTAPFSRNPTIGPLAAPSTPRDSPQAHSLYLTAADISDMARSDDQATPSPAVQSPWAHLDLQTPSLPVSGAIFPLPRFVSPQAQEVPNPVLPCLSARIEQERTNSSPNHGRPSIPEDKPSSLPTPDLSVSNKPFRQFLSPSPRARRSHGDLGNTATITCNGLPQIAPETVDGLPQVSPEMLQEVLSNPWAQPQRPVKRVRFAPLPGEVGEDDDSPRACSPQTSVFSNHHSSSGIECEHDNDEDYIEAGLPQQKAQNVARAKKIAALATAVPTPHLASARPCSPPPPSRMSTDDLPSEVTLFRNHFAKMEGKQHPLASRPTPIRFLAENHHVTPSSQAADAAAQRFVDADRRKYNTSGALLEPALGASGGVPKLRSALKSSAVSHDDALDDVSAVINNLGDFLGSWDLDAELTKATTEKEKGRDSDSGLGTFSLSMDIGQWT